MTKSKMSQLVIRLWWIVFSITLIAVAVNMFMAPHEIAAGGLTGLAIILESATEGAIDRSISVWIGNGIVVIATLIFLGREVFVNTVIGALLLPVAINFVPNHTLVQDRMLAMVVGSVIFGVAVSILYKNRASSGGTAIPPLILQKYTGLKPSIGLFVTDGAVVIFSLYVFDVDSFFFAILSIFITMVVMGYIENGMSKKKRVHIISKQSDAIVADVMKELGKSVTTIPTVGSYQNEQMPMLMVTMDSGDYRKLKEIVDKHDKQAFMVTDVVSDVHGRGFTYGSGSV
ncbi:MAG: YitT family protein [Defluviitaleaceae bacterium]|nr:YitT family protein [Defluviitaleaceae bacterium]